MSLILLDPASYSLHRKMSLQRISIDFHRLEWKPYVKFNFECSGHTTCKMMRITSEMIRGHNRWTDGLARQLSTKEISDIHARSTSIPHNFSALHTLLQILHHHRSSRNTRMNTSFNCDHQACYFNHSIFVLHILKPHPFTHKMKTREM